MSGVFGIFLPDQTVAAELTYLGLYALQHRGQESVGMTVSDGERIRVYKGMGLVSNVFTDEALASLPGSIALGHARYAAAGTPHIANAQPLLALSRLGQIAIAHNGNLTNAAVLRDKLMHEGALFQTSTDSEVILNLIAHHTGDSLEDALADTAKQLVGAATLVSMSTTQLLGYRDPMGNRPLSIGRLKDGYVLASETSAFSTIGAEYVRDVEPGEMVVIDADGLHSKQVMEPKGKAFCVFEYIYFSRPDSEVMERNVHEVRKAIGRILAREHPVDADVVIPTPDSGISAAMGYAEEADIHYEVGLIKNRYVGRTFIQPSQEMRQLGVRIKLNPIRHVIEGKRVVLIDDSIVRGNTTANAIAMVRESGAKEVHMVVASPAFKHPCYYGIDVPAEKDLIAATRSVDEIRALIGADSLHYLSFEGLFEAVGIPQDQLCTGCFSGVYPTDVPKVVPLDLLESDGPSSTVDTRALATESER